MNTLNVRSGLLFGRRSSRIACFGGWMVVATVCVGCGDDDSPGGDAGSDAAISDAEVAPDASATPQVFGRCTTNADCPTGLTCDREIPSSIAVNGAPMGMIDQARFPGGSCTPRALAPFDSEAACLAGLPQPSQGCGPKGTCVLEDLNDETFAGCRPACEPSATRSGCAREGYTCDFGVKACVEGCRGDAECRVLVLDSDGNGAPDTLAYDTESRAICDPDTARCTHPGNASVPIGSSCERLDDCSADGACLEGPRALAGLDFPGGYCSVIGCDVEGRECPSGSVCEPLRSWLGASTSAPACFSRCEVGAEPAELRIGARGHGEGCREGYRCHYNGGEGAASGVCVGGIYNDVTRNNVGAGCTRNADCYSPYGYGACLRYSATSALIRASTGTCTILDCNAPGLPDDICGSGNECITFSGDLTFCIQNCASAEECADGYACTDEDGEPGTAKVCFPACVGNADCRTSERCLVAQGAVAGRCVAMAGSSG